MVRACIKNMHIYSLHFRECEKLGADFNIAMTLVKSQQQVLSLTINRVLLYLGLSILFAPLCRHQVRLRAELKNYLSTNYKL